MSCGEGVQGTRADLSWAGSAHDGHRHALRRGQGGGVALEGGLEQRVQLQVAVGVDHGNGGSETRLS